MLAVHFEVARIDFVASLLVELGRGQSTVLVHWVRWLPFPQPSSNQRLSVRTIERQQTTTQPNQPNQQTNHDELKKGSPYLTRLKMASA